MSQHNSGKLFASAICFLVAAQFVAADEALDRVKLDRVTEKTAAEYLIQEAGLATELMAAAKRGRIAPKARKPAELSKEGQRFRYVFKSRQDRDATVEQLSKRIADPQLPYIYVDEWQPGDVGRLPGGDFYRYRVTQVVDAENALVEQTIIVLGGEKIEHLFWLKGSTEQWADDRQIELPGTYVVRERKQYGTALGSSRTVPAIERLGK